MSEEKMNEKKEMKIKEIPFTVQTTHGDNKIAMTMQLLPMTIAG